MHHIKLSLKHENDQYRNVIESERHSLFKQIDNYKLLVAELKTENQDMKGLVVDLRKQVSVANHLVESRGMETMNEHVRELKMIVD